MIKQQFNKVSFVRKYKNLGYALAIFAYVDLAMITIACTGKDVLEKRQIKQDAEQILNTPDLTTGLEELDRAVEMDLADLEQKYSNNKS